MNTKTQVQEVVVKVDTSTLAKSSRGSVTGILFIRVDGASFPETNWSDFPVVILGWWLEPASMILRGTIDVWECRFVDGPFSFRLTRQREDTWTLVGFNHEHVKFTATISCEIFIQSLLAAAHQILHECRQRGWKSRDIENLDLAAQAVQHALT